MNPSDFKFTLYDIISYTFCGAISLILIYVVIEIKNVTIPETDLAKFILNLISLKDVVSFILTSYFVGKLVSALSSIFFEKMILGWLLKNYSKNNIVEKYISTELYNHFKTRFSKLFNSNYKEDNWRILTTYVEENRPASYSTAFTFLAYYGMSRNLMLIFLTTSLFLVFTDLLLASVFTIVSIVELYEYLRFRKYFHEQVIYAFLNIKEGDRTNG